MDIKKIEQINDRLQSYIKESQACIDRINKLLDEPGTQSSSELPNTRTDEGGREVREDVGPVGFGSGKPMD